MLWSSSSDGLRPPERAAAAAASGTRPSRDHKDSRTEVRFALAIPRIPGTGGTLADVTNDLDVVEPTRRW